MTRHGTTYGLLVPSAGFRSPVVP
ncbi:hypothetical protein ACFW2V_32660 [Streptomyces sp. NPDC058947]